MTDFSATRALFHIPEGVVYMDGNSLGPLPLGARERVAAMLREEWGDLLIRGWNEAGWFGEPLRLGDRIGRLIGAPEGSVVVGDTLSVKVFQALASAIELRPERRVVPHDPSRKARHPTSQSSCSEKAASQPHPTGRLSAPCWR